MGLALQSWPNTLRPRSAPLAAQAHSQALQAVARPAALHDLRQERVRVQHGNAPALAADPQLVMVAGIVGEGIKTLAAH